MTPDTSIINFMLSAGLVVKMVMLILILASVFSWMMIIQRYWLFRRLQRTMLQFQQQFNTTSHFDQLDSYCQQHHAEAPLQNMFQLAFYEYGQLTPSNQSLDNKLNRIERIMHITEQKSLQKLECNLGFLATVGSVSPYVGLFGTVWGIMTSFTALGGVQQATIAMVAPGISEALIATAFGLFAAIPAVIAYNRFSIKLNEMQGQFDIFKQELLSKFEQLLFTASDH